MSFKYLNSGQCKYFTLCLNCGKCSPEKVFLPLMYIKISGTHGSAIIYLNLISFCSPLIFTQQERARINSLQNRPFLHIWVRKISIAQTPMVFFRNIAQNIYYCAFYHIANLYNHLNFVIAQNYWCV